MYGKGEGETGCRASARGYLSVERGNIDGKGRGIDFDESVKIKGKFGEDKWDGTVVIFIPYRGW